MLYGGGISSRFAEGTRLVTKTMPRISYCLEPIAIEGQGCPGKLFSLIFIGFHWFPLISGGFEATWGQKVGQPVAGCGGLWQPVAPCGGIILPL